MSILSQQKEYSDFLNKHWKEESVITGFLNYSHYRFYSKSTNNYSIGATEKYNIGCYRIKIENRLYSLANDDLQPATIEELALWKKYNTDSLYPIYPQELKHIRAYTEVFAKHSDSLGDYIPICRIMIPNTCMWSEFIDII